MIVARPYASRRGRLGFDAACPVYGDVSLYRFHCEWPKLFFYVVPSFITITIATFPTITQSVEEKAIAG